jgi:hypothetical protein
MALQPSALPDERYLSCGVRVSENVVMLETSEPYFALVGLRNRKCANKASEFCGTRF